MSKGQRLEGVLDKARGKEKEYNWMKAAEFYRRALGVTGKNDFLRKGQIQERIGLCLYRAAMQAESQEQFKERMQQTIETYERARGFYEKLTKEQKVARMFRCAAVAKYLGFWVTSDPSEKRVLLNECLELKGKALMVFFESRDMREYGRMYSELPLAFFLRVVLEWDRQTVKEIVEKGLEWGEKAVAALSEFGDSCEIAGAYFVLATCLYFFGEFFVGDPEKQEQNRLKVVERLRNAVEFSERVDDAFLVGLSHLWLGFSTGGEESTRHFEKTLECGKRTHDNFLIAGGLDDLAYVTFWKAIATEDPEKRRTLVEKAMQFYGESQQRFSIMSFLSPRGGMIAPPGGHAEHYLFLAAWETKLEKKLEFLEKSEKAGVKALRVAEDSDIPYTIFAILHILSKTLEDRARLEPDSDKKESLLEEALKHRKRTIEILEQRTPFEYWNLGVMHNYLAGIMAQLADIELDLDRKRRLLEEAVLSEEKCLKLCNKMMPILERRGDVTRFAVLQGYQDTYATLLTRLYNLTRKPEHLRKAIEILSKAIQSASKLDMISLIAESYWKIAKAQDVLGEHLEATESFERASESYTSATEKIPQLKDFYQDNASYMQAWSEIEKAKRHHAKGQYGRAKSHYEKAADLHKSAEQWNYLNQNYLAWARLEQAEDLSRREKTKEAIHAFQKASDMFAEAKRSFQTELETLEARDEKQMATELDKASDIRHEYCLARIILEKAKILDRRGDHAASSRKYGSAAEKFQKAIDGMEHESDRQELRPIIDLCRAWQMMTRAEAQASPDLFLEASQLFDEAKEHSSDEKAKVLAQGHSRFCKALEAGTRFEDTGDAAIYSSAKKHLEASEKHYLKAGFKSASEYSKATHMLFDAYIYLSKAEMETEPGKKAQYYKMTERVLQASAGSFMTAKHPEKSEEVRRLLEGVKEKRQLAMSLTEVLHAPTITSTTTSFSTPTATHEQPVGLERFEHADLQAHLILRVRDVKVGEDIDLEIELINAGKAPALLIKVEKVIPESFEIRKVPETFRVEGNSLNMKGKKLNPLRTEEVKMVIKPLSKGRFIMKPRIWYLDETGKYKSHDPEPVAITVRELGIKGWIKGER